MESVQDLLSRPDERDIGLFSFDVFDTCVCRPYLEPQDIFFDLGERYLNSTDTADVGYTARDVAQFRLEAERRVRRANIHGADVTLSDIYRKLAEISGIRLDLERLRSIEIDLEIDSAYPIAATLREVEHARTLGKVIFTSDMYLPHEVIEKILTKTGFLTAKDRLYVSSEIGKNKMSAALYHELLAKEGFEAIRTLHAGDNFLADFHRARRAGINARWVRRIDLNSYEQAGVEPSQVSRNLVGSSRCIRLQLMQCGDARKTAVSQNFLYSVASPFLTAFVAWVMQQSVRDGVSRLYFVSRDGQILYKLACQLGSLYPSVEVRYLYGSRQAWFAASILNCDESDTYWAFLSGMSRSPVAILDRLGLSWEEAEGALPEMFAAQRLKQLSSTELCALKSLVWEGDLRSRILHNAAVLRGTVCEYLEQEGLFDGTNWAIVDIGWELNSQSALRRICQQSSSAIRVRGYYLGVFANHVRSDVAGEFRAYFAERGAEVSGYHDDGWLFDSQSRVVLEHLVTLSDHGTVIGYRCRSKWEPITALSPQGDHLREVQAYHDAVLDYADIAVRMGSPLKEHESYMRCANAALKTYLSNPAPDDVYGVAQLSTNIEQSHDDMYAKPMARPLRIRDVAGLVGSDLIPGRDPSVERDYYWVAGSAAISNWRVRLLYRILKSGRRLAVALAGK